MQEYTAGVQPVPGYTLQKFLGRGGFGQVWKATAPGGIPIAMKVIDLQEQQALKELRALNFMRLIKHPHLVPIQGLWIKDERGEFLEVEQLDFVATTSHGPRRPAEVLIAMGLGDKNLLDRLRECQKETLPGIPSDELLGYMEESAKAIDYLNQARHDLGSGAVSILHCDIKPQNILIVGDTAQVCDFGLARVVTEASVSNPIYTAAYVAPEMLRDNRPSASTDQYSLAISYVEMRTGSLPLNATGPAMLYAHLAGKLDLTRLPPEEAEVIRKATDIEPAKRFASCTEMVRALRRAIEGTPSMQGASMRPTGPLLLMPEEEIVPGYKLKKLLGKGGYGAVWEAWAPGGIKVALKVVRNLDAPSGKQEFRALELMKSVKHKNLLEIHAYWLLDKEGQLIADEVRDRPDAPRADTLVLATQLAQGNLNDRLKESQAQGNAGIPPKELLNYMWQVAEAIDYLNQPFHKLGDKQISIVHRDIKPENVLIADGTIRVADFGLAKILEGTSAEVHAESIGMTLAYAAPELMENRVTPWTDQYALALTYYRLRTGFMPFGVVQSQEELIAIHITGRLDLGRLPEAEQEALRVATALKPESRYACCLDMVRSLMRACALTEADIVLPQAYVQTGRGLFADPTRRGQTAAQAVGQMQMEQTAASYASIKPLTAFPSGLSPSMTPPSLPDTGKEEGYRQETDWQVPSQPFVPSMTPTGGLEFVKPPPQPRSLMIPLIVGSMLMVALGVGLAMFIFRDGTPIASGTGTQPAPTQSTVAPTRPQPQETKPQQTPVQETQTRPVQTSPRGPNPEKAQEHLAAVRSARLAKDWAAAKAALTAAEKETPPEHQELRTHLLLEQALLEFFGEPRDLASAANKLKVVKSGAFRLPPGAKVELAQAMAQWARLEPETDAWRHALDVLRPLLSQTPPVPEQPALMEDYSELVSTHLDAVLADASTQGWNGMQQVLDRSLQPGPWTLALRAEALLATHPPGRVPASARQVIDQATGSAEVAKLPLKIAPYLQALAALASAEPAKAAKSLINADARAPWTASENRKQRAVDVLRQVAGGLRQAVTARKPFRDAADAEVALEALKQAERWDSKSFTTDDWITFALAASIQNKPEKELIGRVAAKAMEAVDLDKKPWGPEAMLVYIAMQDQDSEPGKLAALQGYLRLSPLIPERWSPDLPPANIYHTILKPAVALGDLLGRNRPDLEQQLAVLHGAIGRLMIIESNLYAPWPDLDPIQRGYDAFYAANQREPDRVEYENGMLYFLALKELRDAQRTRYIPARAQQHQKHLANADTAILQLAGRKALESIFLRAKLGLCKGEPDRAYVALGSKTGGTAAMNEMYVPLLLARVELCLDHWKDLRITEPEAELRIAQDAVRLATDPITKAIAEADLTLFLRKLHELKMNVPTVPSDEQTEKVLQNALRLAPNYPLAWSWKVMLGSFLFQKSKIPALPAAERRSLAEAALKHLEDAVADRGLEPPDDDNRKKLNTFVQSVRKALEEMPR